MLNKLKAFWDLFKVGSSVVNPELWKKRQITATVLAGLVLAVVNLAATFGYSIPIDSETASIIAGGILALVNVVLTLITSDKAGIPVNSQDKVKGLSSEDAIIVKPYTNDFLDKFNAPNEVSKGE